MNKDTISINGIKYEYNDTYNYLIIDRKQRNNEYIKDASCIGGGDAVRPVFLPFPHGFFRQPILEYLDFCHLLLRMPLLTPQSMQPVGSPCLGVVPFTQNIFSQPKLFVADFGCLFKRKDKFYPLSDHFKI